MIRNKGGSQGTRSFEPYIQSIKLESQNTGPTILSFAAKLAAKSILLTGGFAGYSILKGYKEIKGLYTSGIVTRLSTNTSHSDSPVEVEKDKVRKIGGISMLVIGYFAAAKNYGGSQSISLSNLQENLNTGDSQTGVSPGWTRQAVEKMNCTHVEGDVVNENSNVKVIVPSTPEIINLLRPEGLNRKIEIGRQLVDIFNRSETILGFYGTPECKQLREQWVALHSGNADKARLNKIEGSEEDADDTSYNFGTDFEHLIWSLIDTRLSPEILSDYQVRVNEGTSIDHSKQMKSVDQLNTDLTLRLAQRSQRIITPNSSDTPLPRGIRKGGITITPELDKFKTEYGEALVESYTSFDKLAAVVFIKDAVEKPMSIAEYAMFAEGIHYLHEIKAINRDEMNLIMSKVVFPDCESCEVRRYCAIPNIDQINTSREQVKPKGFLAKLREKRLATKERLRRMHNAPPIENIPTEPLEKFEYIPTTPEPNIEGNLNQTNDDLTRQVEEFLVNYLKENTDAAVKSKKGKAIKPGKYMVVIKPDGTTEYSKLEDNSKGGPGTVEPAKRTRTRKPKDKVEKK